MFIISEGTKFYDLDYGFISSNNSYDEINGYILYPGENSLFIGFSLVFSVSQAICRSLGFEQGSLTFKRTRLNFLHDIISIDNCSENSTKPLDCTTSGNRM